MEISGKIKKRDDKNSITTTIPANDLSAYHEMILIDYPKVDWGPTTTISWFNNLAFLCVKTVWLKVKCFGKTLISVQPVKAGVRERL